MTTLLLVRHGETPWNHENRIIGHSDQPLNQTGKSQAETVARTLREQHSTSKAIYTSPLMRAQQTAETIAKQFDVTPCLASDLSESGFGELEGMLIAEFKEKYREEIEAFHLQYPTKKKQWNHSLFPGLETLNALETRMRKICLEICAHHPGETIIVVSHSRAIRAFLSNIKQCDLDTLSLPNCSVSRVHFDTGCAKNPFEIIYLGKTFR